MIKRYQGRVIPYTNLIVSRDTRVYVQKPFSGYSDILARQSGTFFTFFLTKKSTWDIIVCKHGSHLASTLAKVPLNHDPMGKRTRSWSVQGRQSIQLHIPKWFFYLLDPSKAISGLDVGFPLYEIDHSFLEGVSIMSRNRIRASREVFARALLGNCMKGC